MRWVCSKCQEELKPGAKVLSTPTQDFHDGCFQCDECGAVLPGGSYYAVTRGATTLKLCGGCAGKRQAVTCGQCKQPIRTARRVVIGGRAMHEHCGVCSVCSTALPNSAYAYPSGGKFRCEQHATSSSAEVRTRASDSSQPVRLVVVLETVPLTDSIAKRWELGGGSSLPLPVSSGLAPAKGPSSAKAQGMELLRRAQSPKSAPNSPATSVRTPSSGGSPSKVRSSTQASPSSAATPQSARPRRDTSSDSSPDAGKRVKKAVPPPLAGLQKSTPSTSSSSQLSRSPGATSSRKNSLGSKSGLGVQGTLGVGCSTSDSDTDNGGSGSGGGATPEESAQPSSNKLKGSRPSSKGGGGSGGPVRRRVVAAALSGPTGDFTFRMDRTSGSHTCMTCGLEVQESVQLRAGLLVVHRQCAVCSRCGTGLLTEGALEHEWSLVSGRSLCAKCAEVTRPKRGHALVDLFESPSPQLSPRYSSSSTSSSSSTHLSHSNPIPIKVGGGKEPSGSVAWSTEQQEFWEWMQGSAEVAWPTNAIGFGEQGLVADVGWRGELGTEGEADPYRFVDHSVPYFAKYMAASSELFFVSADVHAVLAIDRHAVHEDKVKKYRAVMFTSRGEDRLVVTMDPARSRVQALREAHPLLTDPAGMLLRAKNEEALRTDLVEYERRLWKPKSKFGVLLVRDSQRTEDEMYSNGETTPGFERFLQFLGERVPLVGFQGYSGGLSTKDDSNGSHSVYTTHRGHEIMFHVAPLIPATAADTQGVFRKKFNGNDVVQIIFKDASHDAGPINPEVFTSHFNHVFAVVEEVPNSGSYRYRLALAYKHGTRPSRPYLAHPAVFDADDPFRDFLLTKLLNAERASMNSQEFTSAVRKTRRMLLDEIFIAHAPKKILKNLNLK